MALNKQKKLQYVEQILEEVKNDNIDGKEDSILLEVALDFMEDLQGKDWIINELKEGDK